MNSLITTIFCCCFIASIAQKKTVRFSNITNVALLKGSSQNAFGLETINGIKIDKWRVGIGVGIDNYGTKSIPVFVDVRRSFSNKKWQPLVYADGGIDYHLYNDAFNSKLFDQTNMFKLFNTFFGEAGVGLSKAISKKNSINITLGFSYKQLSYLERDFNATFPVIAGSLYNTNDIQKDFYYRRLALRVGMQF